MFRKKVGKLEYNPEYQKPVIQCSICTGEQVGGLKDIHNGKFQEVMLIKNEKDLDIFREMCGQKDIMREY